MPGRRAVKELWVSGTIEVTAQGSVLAFTFTDLRRHHGPGSPAGVAHAVKVRKWALPLLAPDGPAERREIGIRTASAAPGPGRYGDGHRAVRAVMSFDETLWRPDLGRERLRLPADLSGMQCDAGAARGLSDGRFRLPGPHGAAVLVFASPEHRPYPKMGHPGGRRTSPGRRAHPPRGTSSVQSDSALQANRHAVQIGVFRWLGQVAS